MRPYFSLLNDFENKFKLFQMQVFQCDTFLELIQEYYAMRGEVSGNGPPRGKNFSSYLHHFLEQLELNANKDTPS